MLRLLICCLLFALHAAAATPGQADDGRSAPHRHPPQPPPQPQPRILILGAGVAGVIAARTLRERGLTDFVIVEARGEVGGRVRSGRPGDGAYTVEFGANWIQGNVNPILCLALKHGLKTVNNDIYGSITTYSDMGPEDFADAITAADDAFSAIVANAGAQLDERGPDLSVKVCGRRGRGIADGGGCFERDFDLLTSYSQWDFEYAVPPAESSWLASGWNNNLTYNLYGEDNLLSVDQRGFKHFIQAEAATFLQPHQIVYNATVSSVDWSAPSRRLSDGSTYAPREAAPPIIVTLANGTKLDADYVICTFSLGVLQNEDVGWVPGLPEWKREAIAAFTMTTYTKVFVQFAGEDRFWFDTEMALYASPRRGRYPLWQSLDVPSSHKPQFLPGSRILFGTVVGDDALDISALSGTTNEGVKEDVREVLRDMFPNVTLPDFDVFYHDWAADPLFRGSYSNFPPSYDPALHRNLRASVGHGRLRWAGEAGSAAWFGFLHGAYADGQATARELADCIQHNHCADDYVPRPRGPQAPVRG
ncbi:amine oxidase [Schizophyllum fasciatum]